MYERLSKIWRHLWWNMEKINPNKRVHLMQRDFLQTKLGFCYMNWNYTNLFSVCVTKAIHHDFVVFFCCIRQRYHVPKENKFKIKFCCLTVIRIVLLNIMIPCWINWNKILFCCCCGIHAQSSMCDTSSGVQNKCCFVLFCLFHNAITSITIIACGFL